MSADFFPERRAIRLDNGHVVVPRFVTPAVAHIGAPGLANRDHRYDEGEAHLMIRIA